MEKKLEAFNPERIEELTAVAYGIFSRWDIAEQEIRSQIASRDLSVLCKPGCVPCCYTRKACSVSEAAAIVDYIEKNLSSGEAEAIRLRVESDVSSLAKLRADGACQSADTFARSGGMECSFLREGQCAIHPVRPLECRGQLVTSDTSPQQCFVCPHAVVAIEAEACRNEVAQELHAKEAALGVPELPWYEPASSVQEAVSVVWQYATSESRGAMDRSSGAMTQSRSVMTPDAWVERLKSRGTVRDQTWQDDRDDFRALRHPVSLPDEGDYGTDLTVVTQRPEVEELYDRKISVDGLPSFPSLYKRELGCTFDWDQRRFVWDESADKEMPYAVWMSDGVQERLMMWEAAKRCRGHVLCGGMGLGLFPQLALSLPRVESVHIVDVDPNIIDLIQDTWRKKPWPRMSACTVTASPIEDFLKNTRDTFDTVYIDTWDAIYHEYLLHLNELAHLSERVVRPGGEILLWANDMMVRQFLEVARSLAPRRAQYLKASPDAIGNIRDNYPLLHRLVVWLRKHPKSSDIELQTAAYRIATRERDDLGILKLTAVKGGGAALLENKMRRESNLN